MRPTVRSLLTAGTCQLDARNSYGAGPHCKICGRSSVPFDIVDFNKFCEPGDFYRFGFAGVGVYYWRCRGCGFLFTDFFDDWTTNDFSQFVYNKDYLKVDPEYVSARPSRIAGRVAEWLRGCEAARILDYGSGAGVFVERMRSLGYGKVEGYDPFSSPRRPSGKFDIITCFEVIEHSPQPIGTFADILSFMAEDGCVMLTQTVQPPDLLTQGGSWWYLGPRNGHVSTYADETLAAVAARFGLTLYRGSTLYAMAGPVVSRHAKQTTDIVGPSFSSLRLFAPTQLQDHRITFPTADTVWWHPVAKRGPRRYRWTGNGTVMWRAEWPNVSILQVRIPVLHEVWKGASQQCAIRLGVSVEATRLDRGELVAELNVAGTRAGILELLVRMAENDTEGATLTNSDDPDLPVPRGVPILLDLEPLSPSVEGRIHEGGVARGPGCR